MANEEVLSPWLGVDPLFGHINDFNPPIDTNLQFNGVPYDLDLTQSYDANASVINNYSYNNNKRFLDSELDNNVFGIGLNQGVGMERTDSALGFSITPGSSISSPPDKVVLYNINSFPFPDQSLQANDVNSTVFYINNPPSPISDLGPSPVSATFSHRAPSTSGTLSLSEGPSPRAGMFTVPKQLSAKPKRPRKQSESRISLPELFIRMGLADNHEVARKREQRVLNLLRQQGFKLGERTWIRDTTEQERRQIIDEIYRQTFDEYGYGKDLIEVIIRRGSYYLMQGRLRRLRRSRRNANRALMNKIA